VRAPRGDGLTRRGDACAHGAVLGNRHMTDNWRWGANSCELDGFG